MILHVDMDAFFAAVEQRDNPELIGKCVVVGRLFGRGVVSAASYEARAFGVSSAMPVFRAQQLCPQAVFVPPRMARYREVSHQVMAVLSDFSPLVEPVSIDEAFLDISGSARLLGSPEKVAQNIKAAIFEAVGLTCSVGAAPARFLAKIASDMNKPDGLTIIAEDAVDAFIEQLPVGKVPGVGPVTRQSLAKLGVSTLGDVRHIPESVLTNKLGKFGKRLAALARGRDDVGVSPRSRPQSVSTETTLTQDTRDLDLLSKHLLRQADEVCRQLRHLAVSARVVELKIKYADFQEKSRRVTLSAPTASAEVVYTQALRLLEQHLGNHPVRLIGVGVSHLVWPDRARQLDIFSDSPVGDLSGDAAHQKKWDQVAKTLDAVSDRFGGHIVKRASLNDRLGKNKKEKK